VVCCTGVFQRMPSMSGLVLVALLFLKFFSFSSMSDFPDKPVKVDKRRFCESEDSAVAQKRHRSCSSEESALKREISYFVEHSLLEEFKVFFKQTAFTNPEQVDFIISSVISHNQPEFVFYLMEEEGYEVDFKSSHLKRNFLKYAIKMRKTEIVLAILNNSKKEDFDFALELSVPHSALHNEISKLQFKRPFVDVDFDGTSASVVFDKVSEFRQTSVRYSKSKSSSISIYCSRLNILSKAYTSSCIHGSEWYRGLNSIFIMFEDEKGVDDGGLFNEWLGLLLESIMAFDDSRIFVACEASSKPQSSSTSSSMSSEISIRHDFSEPFFTSNSNGIYAPNLNYDPSLFEFIGSIFALAFVHDIPWGVEFIPVLYRLLVLKAEEDDSVWENDLKIIDGSIYKSLNDLRSNDIDLSLFTDMDEAVPLTRENLEVFIYNKSRDLAYLKYHSHLRALQAGFLGILTIEKFSELRLSALDMRKIMLGDAKLDSEDFLHNVDSRKMTNVDNKKWIFEIIDEMEDSERTLFFKFLTGRRGIPFKGLKNLPKRLIFVSIEIFDDTHLPTASTCSTLLKIPTYSSKAIMKEKLLLAIKSCDSFHLE
jgi:hypothetical protein